MLQRKLLMTLGSLVALQVLLIVVAIVLLQDVLDDMGHISGKGLSLVEQTNQLNATISSVEIELYELRLGRTRHLDTLIKAVEKVHRHVAALSLHYVAQSGKGAEIYRRVAHAIPRFEHTMGTLSIVTDERIAAAQNEQALKVSLELRNDILELSLMARDHVREEQTMLTAKFRNLVLGLSITSILVINLSIIVLLRMAAMILKPVKTLIYATEKLANEQFDFRVKLNQRDEFDQLAQAYNKLAEQLQANEQRKVETLHQVALTLNHELNNVGAIIEMQLQLLSRQAGQNDASKKYLHQIRDNLDRMTRTVEALKHIRRIVLTDYVSGIKMLDLEKSVEEDSESSSAVDRMASGS